MHYANSVLTLFRVVVVAFVKIEGPKMYIGRKEKGYCNTDTLKYIPAPTPRARNIGTTCGKITIYLTTLIII